MVSKLMANSRSEPRKAWMAGYLKPPYLPGGDVSLIAAKPKPRAAHIV